MAEILDLFEYADDPAAQAAYPGTGHHSFTFNANAQLDTADKKFGGSSLLLDGTGDYLDIVDNADWDMGAGDFCCEYFIKTSGNSMHTCGQATSGGSDVAFYLYIDGSGNVVFNIDDGLGNAVTSTTAINDGAWHHVAGVRSSNASKIYIDGTSEGTPTSGLGTIPNRTTKFSIGRIGELDASYFNGWIDEFRLTKGAPIYTGDFTPSTVPFQADTDTVLMLHFDGADAATSTIDSSRIEATSESTLKEEGSYSMQGWAAITDSLNDTLTRTVSPTVDLSGLDEIKFSLRATRTGANIKVGIHDVGGTTSEKTYTIVAADTWERVTWDISAISDANKDAIDQIIITVINADADNTFYIDRMFAYEEMSELVDSYVTLLLPFDGTDGATATIDTSGNNHIVTFNNSAQIDTGSFQFAPSSILFASGTSDYIQIPEDIDFHPVSGDFTMDFWMRTTSVANTFPMGNHTAAGASDWSFRINDTANKITVNFIVGAANKSVVSDTSINTGAWFHIAGVIASGTLSLYINGTSEGTPIALGGAVDQIGGDLGIGRPGEFDGVYYDGAIDMYRISKGIARWTANFTPPPYPYHKIAKTQVF